MTTGIVCASFFAIGGGLRVLYNRFIAADDFYSSLKHLENRAKVATTVDELLTIYEASVTLGVKATSPSMNAERDKVIDLIDNKYRQLVSTNQTILQ